ncbi:type II secretion system F family protein [Patescibacteria group bacterium]|nr:type II secretion system F family protein [Patescibacteria group bacterium]
MAKFHYIASNIQGKMIEGDITAGSAASVLGWMSDQGLRPVSVKETEVGSWMKKSFKESINMEDKVFITKYLALMLRVGTDLFKAIDILVADFDKQAVKSLLLEIKDTLGKGQPLYTAFANHPNEFSPVFVSLIRAGEETGNLEEAFGRLSKDIEKEKALKSKVKAALIYPVILVGLSLTILFLMVTFALPKIAETFIGGDAEIPTFSRIVFSTGLFFRNYILVILPIFATATFGMFYFFSKTTGGKKIGARIIASTPVIKGVVKKMAIQRFAGTLASLLKSGTPILDALEVTADAVGSSELEAVLRRIAREGIKKGLTVGEAFRKEPYFPKVVANLIGVSEQAGHMEDVLETLAEFYEGEIDSSIKTLVSFLEPMLLLVIGIIVAIIALAIIVPVYQLVGQI